MKGRGANIIRTLGTRKGTKGIHKVDLYQEELFIPVSNRTNTEDAKGLSLYIPLVNCIVLIALNHGPTTRTGDEEGVASKLITQ